MPHFKTFADSIDPRLTVTRAPGQLLQSSSQNTFLLKDTSNSSNALWRSANNISGGGKAWIQFADHAMWQLPNTPRPCQADRSRCCTLWQEHLFCVPSKDLAQWLLLYIFQQLRHQHYMENAVAAVTWVLLFINSVPGSDGRLMIKDLLLHNTIHKIQLMRAYASTNSSPTATRN